MHVNGTRYIGLLTKTRGSGFRFTKRSEWKYRISVSAQLPSEHVLMRINSDEPLALSHVECVCHRRKEVLTIAAKAVVQGVASGNPDLILDSDHFHFRPAFERLSSNDQKPGKNRGRQELLSPM